MSFNITHDRISNTNSGRKEAEAGSWMAAKDQLLCDLRWAKDFKSEIAKSPLEI